MRAKCCTQNILGRYQVHASHPRTPHTKIKKIIKLHTKEKKKENGIELIKLIANSLNTASINSRLYHLKAYLLRKIAFDFKCASSQISAILLSVIVNYYGIVLIVSSHLHFFFAWYGSQCLK